MTRRRSHQSGRIDKGGFGKTPMLCGSAHGSRCPSATFKPYWLVAPPRASHSRAATIPGVIPRNGPPVSYPTGRFKPHPRIGEVATGRNPRMGNRQKPGENPNRPGEYRETGPRGGEVKNPRQVTMEKGDKPLPPTSEKGNTWKRTGPPKP